MVIFLLGFMGSGKSTIGRALAKLSGTSFIDLDHHIEEQEGRSITEIFTNSGEAVFRQLETNYLKKLIGQDDNCIVSLGGGTPCFNENMKLINSSGTSVYLKTGVDELFSRLVGQKDHRPLLAGKSDDELRTFIKQKIAEREPFYNRSNIIFLTDGGRGAAQLHDILKNSF